MSVNTLIILDQSGSMEKFQSDVKEIYNQIFEYCAKYSVNSVTTIGFSKPPNKPSIATYDGLPKELYHPHSTTPGEAFLLPMLDKLNSSPNEKWQVIFISDGKFDSPQKFENEVNGVTFPQFFPIFISCGDQAAINHLMKAMAPYSYGTCSFLMHNTTELCKVMSDFHEQQLKPCNEKSPFFFENTKMIYSDFPVWPNALDKPKDVQIIYDCIKLFSLCHFDNKLEEILSDLMQNRISYNRTLLINLAQKISTIDLRNSQKIVDAMQANQNFQFNERNVNDDVFMWQRCKDENIFMWQRYKHENIYYRFIAYDNPNNNGAPIPYFWQNNSLAFETSYARIYYNIEIRRINCQNFEPLVLTIRDEMKNLQHYLLDRGQGIIDGGTGSRFAFNVKKEVFLGSEKMPGVGLEFRIDYKKNVTTSPKRKSSRDSRSNAKMRIHSDSDHGTVCYSLGETETRRQCKVRVGAKPISTNEQSDLLMGNVHMQIKVKEEGFICINVFIVPSDNFMKFIETRIDTTGLFIENNCVICLENPAVWYMSICKHLVICDEDEKNYSQNSSHNKRCPKCRKDGDLIRAVNTTKVTNEIFSPMVL